jgi:hypothetical protein
MGCRPWVVPGSVIPERILVGGVGTSAAFAAAAAFAAKPAFARMAQTVNLIAFATFRFAPFAALVIVWAQPNHATHKKSQKGRRP